MIGANKDSFSTLHLPQRIILTQRLQKMSFLINDAMFIVSTVVLLAWFVHFIGIQIPFSHFLPISPSDAFLFIFLGITLLFSAQRHLLSPQDAPKQTPPFWKIAVPIFLASITAFLGFTHVSNFSNHLGLSFVQLSHLNSFCFFLLGIALIPPYTRIPHRFHITHFVVFSVIALYCLVISESIYQLLSFAPAQHIFSVPLFTAFFFVFFSFGILFRWSNRGFFGNFALNSADSILALRLLVINLFLAPLIGFVVFICTKQTLLNVYQIVALVVTISTVITSILLWANVKFLYKDNLEHFLMRETLRIHNIDLFSEKEKLEKTMAELQESKEQYKKKLDYQEAFRDIADKLE